MREMLNESRRWIVGVLGTVLIGAASAGATCIGWSYSRGAQEATYVTTDKAEKTYLRNDVGDERFAAMGKQLIRIEGQIDKVLDKLESRK